MITLKNETFVPSPRAWLFGNKAAAGGDSEQKVEVISRQIVGEFDTAIVRENAEGGLNPWLEKEGYETLKNAEDIIGFYRKRNICSHASKSVAKRSRRTKPLILILSASVSTPVDGMEFIFQ